MELEVEESVNACEINFLICVSYAMFTSDATKRDGCPRLFCAQTRLTLSVMCCRVGALVMESRCKGKRLPGGSTERD